MATLTPKQERFACAVAEGMKQADAYRASYRTANMAAKQVHEESSKLAAHPMVAQRIASLRAEAAERSILKIVDVLNETRRLMLATPAKLVRVDTNGKVSFKLPHELDPDTAAAIRSFEIDDLGRMKYTFWDKNAALDRAAKILGAYDRHNRQRTDPLTELLDRLSGNVIGPSPRGAITAGDSDDDRL